MLIYTLSYTIGMNKTFIKTCVKCNWMFVLDPRFDNMKRQTCIEHTEEEQ
jgi:hypothetical protein